MSFPAPILTLASCPSHQFVVATWLDFAHQTITSPPSLEILSAVDPVTKSIGLHLNGDYQHSTLGRLLSSPRTDHVLFGYRGLFHELSKPYDASLVEGVAQAIRTGLGADRTQQASISTAATVAISGVLVSADKIEPVIWDFVKARGRAAGWLKMHDIAVDEDTREAVAEVLERHVDSVPFNQLARMVDFLEEDNGINQGELAFHPGSVDKLSPLRLRLVRRLLREIDSTAPDYTKPNNDPFLRTYLSLLPFKSRTSKFNRNKVIRTLRKMESDLDPTRKPKPRGWTRFLPEFLRNLIG